MDLSEDRSDVYGDRIFSRNLLCEKGHEAASGRQRDRRWDPDDAIGTSADSSRISFASVVQFEASSRIISAGTL